MRVISDEALAVVTIFQEAEGEGSLGEIAVAEVIRNRMRSGYASDGTVAGTVLRPFQFSGWLSGARNRIRSVQIDDTDHVVQRCQAAWQTALAGSNHALGAVLYFNPADTPKPPAWAKPETFLIAIGKHKFYAAGSIRAPGNNVNPAPAG